MGNPHRKISRSFYPPLPSPLKGRRIVYRVLNRNVQSLVRSLSALLVLFLTAAGTGNKADADSDDSLFDSPQESLQAAAPRRDEGSRRVFKDRITPHWFQNNTRFWYRNDLRGGAKEFILVDAEHGTRQPAFDHQKLAASLSKVAAEQFKAEHLPFSEIEFVEEGKAVRFEAANKTWKCDMNSYECTEIPGSSEKKTSAILYPRSTDLFSPTSSSSVRFSSSGGEGRAEEAILSQSQSFAQISPSPQAKEVSPLAHEATLATQQQTNQTPGP